MISDLNLYQVFYTVAKHQNFSYAAEALYISQPAISKSMKLLESQLQLKLFTRTSKGVLLTPEGELLYLHIKRALGHINEGELLLNKLIHLESGELKIGVSTTLGTYFLLPLLSRFTSQYPKLQVHVVNDSTIHTLESLRKGDLDLAIVSTPIPFTDLTFTPLIPIQDCLVCSPTYYESIGSLSFEVLCNEAHFMLLSKQSVTRLHLENYFSQQGIIVSPHIEASNMDFLIACAQAHLGITSVIKTFSMPLLESQTLVEITLPTPIPSRFIGTIYPTKHALSLAAEQFITFLNDTKHAFN